MHHTQGVAQGLATAKARLAKKELSIARLELVSGQMAASLLDDVKKVLKRSPVQDCYGWLDSTVVLHWVNGDGNYKQFVWNRVKQEKNNKGEELHKVETCWNKGQSSRYRKQGLQWGSYS